ncbi:glycosyltransferase family 8 protein [Entomospira entomophila]|uniref:Glycosyltransferase family 8 protein n=1 Tax=Entomospira entomophila TaxID=2719988 RepID=A0A968G7U4_9SPIO|nr:glycosyltransferase family 8 protein [Entomospira entomophilus]NIZ40197.1 glycosyltransferase family 8 protein [Entomospira entomophilus]WDI35756.1 glycosyltransferase family 8 protein [Entomospira entomophilus]
MSHIPIAYTIDNTYTLPLMAQLVALYENANDTTVYDIYIINRNLDVKNKIKIQALVSQLRSEAVVQFLDISDEQDREIPSIGSWGKETNYRGLLPELVPHLDMILYLDADTLILDDLSHLFQLDLSSHPYAATADIDRHDYNLIHIASKDCNYSMKNLLFQYGYINAGVLLLNLAYWREHNWQKEFIRLLNLIDRHKLVSLPDQDVLNYLAIRDGVNRIYYLPSTYNSLYTHTVESAQNNYVYFNEMDDNYDWYGHIRMIHRNSFVKPSQELVMDRVIVIHFCTLKPWNRSRENDSLVNVFKPYAERVGLDIPSREKQLPRWSVIRKKVKQYRKIIYKIVIINTLVILFFSFFLSFLW